LKLIQNYLRTLLLRKPLRFLRKYESLGNSTTNSLLHHHTFQNLTIPMATSIMTAPLLQRLNLLMLHLYFERNAIVMACYGNTHRGNRQLHLIDIIHFPRWQIRHILPWIRHLAQAFVSLSNRHLALPFRKSQLKRESSLSPSATHRSFA